MLRSHIDKNNNKIKDYLLTFDFSNFMKVDIIKLDYSTKQSNKITDSELYEIKSNSIIDPYRKLFFIDKTIYPQSKYIYELKVTNKENIESFESEKLEIVTKRISPLKTFDPIENLRLINTLISDKPNLVNLTFSLETQVDPNIDLYKEFENIYIVSRTEYNFVLEYDSKQFSKQLSHDNIIENKITFNFNEIPINKSFKIKYNIRYFGVLRIPGLVEIQNECRGEGELNERIKGETIYNSEKCNNFKESIGEYNNIPFFYNTSINACESRKFNQPKLDEYCETQDPGTKWYGKTDIPCRKPIDGKWVQLVVDDNDKTCKSSSKKISNYSIDKRVCLNDSGKAFKIDQKWKYISHLYNGIDKNKQSFYPESTEKYGSDNNIVYKFSECTLPSCEQECTSKKEGKLSRFGKQTDGLNSNDLNDSSICIVDDLVPIIGPNKSTNNCPTGINNCGNNEGPSKNALWTKTSICVDGNKQKCKDIIKKSDPEAEIIEDKVLAKDRVIGKLDKTIKGKWYKCKSVGLRQVDEEYKNVKNGNSRFCDPPTDQHWSRKEDRFVEYDKYFKVDEYNCNLDYCKFKKTTDQFEGLDDIYCGSKEMVAEPKCINTEGVESKDNLWPCGGLKEWSKYSGTEGYEENKSNIKNTCTHICENTKEGGYNEWNDIVDPVENSSKPYNEIDFKQKCEEKDTILPLYEKEYIKTTCNSCNGVPRTARDKCVDGKYGPKNKVSCKDANFVDIGDIEKNTVVASNQINPSKIISNTKPVGYTPQISEYAKTYKIERNMNGDIIDVLEYTTPEYKISCPSRSCAWDFELERLTKENNPKNRDLTMEQKCRGDMITKNLKCKVQLSNEDHHDKYKKSMLCKKQSQSVMTSKDSTIL